MDKCTFCKIVKKESRSWKVYDDSDYIVILPKRSHARGHLLVIPKKHCRWVWDYQNIGEYFELTSKFANVLKKTYKTDFVMGIQHGDGVPHAHNHLICRFPNDGHGSVLNPDIEYDFSDEEKDQICNEIKKNIDKEKIP
jgi:histidine triad (HIT) family protein